jgi:hypothetical protein
MGILNVYNYRVDEPIWGNGAGLPQEITGGRSRAGVEQSIPALKKIARGLQPVLQPLSVLARRCHRGRRMDFFTGSWVWHSNTAVAVLFSLPLSRGRGNGPAAWACRGCGQGGPSVELDRSSNDVAYFCSEEIVRVFSRISGLFGAGRGLWTNRLDRLDFTWQAR